MIFLDNGQKPGTDGQKLTTTMSPLDFVRRDN